MDAANGAKNIVEKLKRSFPPDLDYVVALDTTLAVTAGMKEIEHTLVREPSSWSSSSSFIFLQGWRADAEFRFSRLPVSLIGTFALFPLFGFFHQHAYTFRPRVGDWFGRGRCDCSGRDSGASHRERSVAEKTPALKRLNAGGCRAGHGHRHHSHRGIFADGIYPRHHGPALPAVRRDHRGLGGDLRVQRSRCRPRSRRCCCARRVREHRPVAKILRRVQ